MEVELRFEKIPLSNMLILRYDVFGDDEGLTNEQIKMEMDLNLKEQFVGDIKLW